MAEEKIDYIKEERKQRFLKQYNIIKNKYNLSDAQFADILECSISTFKDSISIKKNNCNSDVMISFCHKYGEELGIDINYLYYGEKPSKSYSQSAVIGKKSDASKTEFEHSADFEELKDSAYMGTFYGYCRNTQYNELDSFTLHLYEDEFNESHAVLKMQCASVSSSGKKRIMEKELYAKPMLLRPSIIHICFQTKQGNDMYVFDYQWLSINSNGKNKHIYCTYGALTTLNRGIAKCPEQQAFVIVNKPIPPQKLHFIDGFLRMTQDEIIVPAEALSNPDTGLLIKNDFVKAFFEKSPQINLFKQEVYRFSEKMLLAAGDANGIDPKTVAKTILYLKEHSLSPKKIDYPLVKLYSKFISSLCLDE